MLTTVIYPNQFAPPTIFEFPLNKYWQNKGANDNFLEVIYRQCNHVDGSEWIGGQKLRSMSVGDMVLATNQATDERKLYFCDTWGWREIV